MNNIQFSSSPPVSPENAQHSSGKRFRRVLTRSSLSSHNDLFKPSRQERFKKFIISCFQSVVNFFLSLCCCRKRSKDAPLLEKQIISSGQKFSCIPKSEAELQFFDSENPTAHPLSVWYFYHAKTEHDLEYVSIHFTLPQHPQILFEPLKKEMGERYPNIPLGVNAVPENHQFYIKAGFVPKAGFDTQHFNYIPMIFTPEKESPAGQI